MKDRISLYPGRVKLNPVAGEANTFDMVRADQPTQEGTALNKANLLNDSTATGLHLGDGEPTPDLAFQKMLKNVQVNPYRYLDKVATTWWNKISNVPAVFSDASYAYIEETDTVILIYNNHSLAYSKDRGKTWTNKLNAVDTTNGYIIDIFYKNGTYYLVCSMAILTSTDLESWTTNKITTPSDFYIDAALLHEDKIIVTLSSGSTGYDYFYYINLTNLKKANRGAYCSGMRDDYKTIYYLDGLFYVTGNYTNIWYTANPTSGTATKGSSKMYSASPRYYFNGKYYYVGANALSGDRDWYLVAEKAVGKYEKMKTLNINSYSSSASKGNGTPNKIFFSLNGKLYLIFCTNYGAAIGVYEVIDNNTTFETRKITEIGEGYKGSVFVFDDEGEEAYAKLFFDGVYETYNTYITEDYLTDMAGNNLTLSPNQSPIHIETGSYTGTGTYGESNPNSLTFGFEPKLVIIYLSTGAGLLANSSYTGWSSSVILIKGQTKIRTMASTSDVDGVVSFDDKSITWYSSTAQSQLNISPLVYNYIAIG